MFESTSPDSILTGLTLIDGRDRISPWWPGRIADGREFGAGRGYIAACHTVGVGVPSGTVTFLFTDVEGSTRLWESAPPVMGAAMARHDELVRSAMEGHGGYVFSTGGMGLRWRSPVPVTR